jgi:ribosomal protein S12
MHIGPRINEFENNIHHFWTREINGVRYHFVHVKQSRLGQPYIGASRMDTGAQVHCSCPRPDCPIGT